ncbi:HutD family protein [Steroidobacter flavus]|uniref:HutD family protein n=1 Tax=Steroidobacter flavus TaxID=1842136 RepID=A0ABV8T210_9GAMM
MRILRASDYRRMPWKNGGGETREVLVSPAGAPLNEIDWRISLATIATDGPFSTFEGIERTLSVIQGAGIRLMVDNEPPKLLLDSSDPCTFAGEPTTSATLVDGTIVDLNVMTRRDAFQHSVRRLSCTGQRRLEVSASTTIVFCQRGEVQLASERLGPEDCAVFDDDTGSIDLNATEPSELIVIELSSHR